jgi:hypothetical protein
MFFREVLEKSKVNMVQVGTVLPLKQAHSYRVICFVYNGCGRQQSRAMVNPHNRDIHIMTSIAIQIDMSHSSEITSCSVFDNKINIEPNHCFKAN